MQEPVRCAEQLKNKMSYSSSGAYAMESVGCMDTALTKI